jgi:triacylglycerol lipase
MHRPLDQVLGALNGLVGDYLHRRENELATPMVLVRDGEPLSAEALAASLAASPRRIVLIVHGLMATEHCFRMEDGEDYGSLLAQDLGFLPLYVRYNSGRHVSESGESLDALLSDLAGKLPPSVEEVVLLGHSMGGLVIRAATHVASERKSPWLPLVRRAVYVGSPHLGAPLERLGNVASWVLAQVGNPITGLIAEIANLRSAGVKDLRYANLRREDWEGVEADALLQNTRHPVPLLPQIRHHLVVGTLSEDPTLAVLFGDALVPVPSAAGRAEPRHRSAVFPQEHVAMFPGRAHLALAQDREVYAQLRAWLSEELSP